MSYTAPEWPRSALITIDTQCDTLDGQPFEIPGTSDVLPRMTELLQAFREAERPIIHIVRLYQPDGSDVELCRREAFKQGGGSFFIAGAPGSELAPELLPKTGINLDVDQLYGNGIQSIGTNEVVIYKPRWGAFYKSPLEQHLMNLGVTTLVFSGCNYPNCPRTSIYEASERDFRLVLVTDAISGMYERGEREMLNIGVNLLTTSQVSGYIR